MKKFSVRDWNGTSAEGDVKREERKTIVGGGNFIDFIELVRDEGR